MAWTSGAQFAVHRGDKEWSIEMRLPITGEGSRMIDPLKAAGERFTKWDTDEDGFLSRAEYLKPGK